MKAFQARSLFLWYDYFSCPQLEQRKSYGADDGDGSQQANAINSIPAYVCKSHFFLALCPVLDCPFEAHVLSVQTWSTLGGGGRCCSLVWWRGNQPGINSSPPGALVAVPH